MQMGVCIYIYIYIYLWVRDAKTERQNEHFCLRPCIIVVVTWKIDNIKAKLSKSTVHFFDFFRVLQKKSQTKPNKRWKIWQTLEDWGLACRWSKQSPTTVLTTRSVGLGVAGFSWRSHGVQRSGSHLSYSSSLRWSPLVSLSPLKRYNFFIWVSIIFAFWGFFVGFLRWVSCVCVRFGEIG